VYQGQEIGMINWKPQSIDEYRDVQTLWNYHHSALSKTEQQRLQRQWRSARDNARTPVQWTDESNAGFTTAETPWMNVNPNYTWLNAAQQEEDDNSILHFYRKAIALRKSLSCVRHGEYQEYRPLSGEHYIYSMEDDSQKILVVCSFCKRDSQFRPIKGFDLNQAELILNNIPDPQKDLLKPYEVRVYLWNK